MASLITLARFHGIGADAAQLQHHCGASTGEASDIVSGARFLGMRAKLITVKPANRNRGHLRGLPLPAIARRTDGSFLVLAAIDPNPGVDRILIHDPAAATQAVISEKQFADLWTGELVLLASRASLIGQMARFDFSWFIPALVKYRRLLAEVLLASLVIQIFTLVTPLFFQVVMDKVLVHQGYSTLTVIAVGLIGVAIFSSILSALRTWVFSHTTSRIDVELGSRLFRHLLALPQAYFESRRVGDSVARVRELEHIRQFLTGNSLTLILDIAFSFVFFVVMFYYSTLLAWIVLASLPLYALLSACVTPVLRRLLNEKFQRGAQNQAFLVECISGIGTLKSGALEPQMARQWDQQLAAYVSSSFRVTKLGTWASETVQLVNKLVTAGTLYFGAKLVIEQRLTVGQLVAFNMLAGQVAQPIIRLAQIWQDFQQTSISMQRLGDILNTRTESSPSATSAQPPMVGSICLENVSFRYRPDGSEVLRNVSIDIRSGEIVGIVGKSGSGKSTLTKLVQRLYTPSSGRVLIDGVDLALVDTTWIRRQVGVVLQENRLFARTVRENIAIADPGMPFDTIVEAARLAGAHDFILELPQGYDTLVGEHGATLSGGQRQRIAIARTLVSNPRILILDEATSALDYESERAVQQNLRRIAQGRTVLIVAHRLSTVRDAHRILVIDRGELVESGTHDKLVRIQNGRYARLHAIQSGHPIEEHAEVEQ